MEILYTAKISTPHGEKNISVISGSATELPEKVDVLTTSAYKRNYAPVPGTLLGALYRFGIDIEELSLEPYLDLREICNVWLSKKISGNISRIGCLEMRGFDRYTSEGVLKCIKAYFQMLDIAATSGVEMKTVAMPLLGGGNQDISANLTLIPIINECIAFLRRNESCDKIIFVEINHERAVDFATALQNIYSLIKREPPKNEKRPLVFISHRSTDKNIADNLCFKFESMGVRVWYAPRDVVGEYAAAITRAIDSCTHFVVIISKNSLESKHVLNEIDLAFNSSKNNIKIKPLRIDDVTLTESFRYYLSRQHWMDAIVPPIEEKLESFVNAVCSDMN